MTRSGEGLYDYIIVGAGTAGCALAHRLSEDADKRILIIEAGPENTSLLYNMPKGFGKTILNSNYSWLYHTEPEPSTDNKAELWSRGRTLGGSSSTNGMCYNRGDIADWDTFTQIGLDTWSWRHISKAFEALEAHELGPAEGRGGSGPLHLAPHKHRNPLCEAFIEAAGQMGVPRTDDLNSLQGERAGYMISNIKHGRRMSAARAFLKPVRNRPNLDIVTSTHVTRIDFNGKQAIGVSGETNGRARSFRCTQTGEVIVASGALNSPKLLQLSGIGPAEHLRSFGIHVLHDSPGVGRNMIEQRGMNATYRLNRRLGLNNALGGLGLAKSVARYFLRHDGPLATCSHEAGAAVKAHPDATRPDLFLALSPTSMSDNKPQAMSVESEPGMMLLAMPIRPTSTGSVMIRSADPAAPPVVRPNYISTEYDREMSIHAFRTMRRLVSQPALARIIVDELRPGRTYQTDEEILNAYTKFGISAYHACGTCKMGHDNMAVVDENLRVRGVSNLRVCDLSVIPFMVAIGAHGATIGLAWRAGDVIRSSQSQTGYAA